MSTATRTAVDPLAEFMREARTIAFRAADHGSHRLYARMKALMVVRLPGLDHRQYEAAARELARMAGV